MNSTGKFTLLEQTIEQLFKNKNETIRYEIPLYQRNYTWDSEQIEPLLEDIVARNEDKSQHYMGVMATTHSRQHNKNGTQMDAYIRIIDGQQRITTSILIIDVLEKMIAEKNNYGYESGFTENCEHVSFRNEIQTEISKDIGQIVLKTKIDIKPKTTIIKKNISIISDFFSKRKDDLEDLLNTFMTLFKLGKLEYQIDRNEEMLVFENLNSKGSPLDEFDLIRNYIISMDNVNSDNAKISLQNFNAEILNILTTGTLKVKVSKINSTFEKFISFFLKWQGFTETFKAYPLYKNFKKFVDISKFEFNDLLLLIKKYLTLYLSITHENGSFNNKLWIRVIKKDAHIPMAFELFKLYSSFSEDDNDDGEFVWKWTKEINDFFKVFSIHIIKLLSVEGTGQSLPTLVEKIVSKLRDGMTSSEMKKWLSSGEGVSSGNTPSDARFVKSLSIRQTQKWIPEAIIDIIEESSNVLNESVDYNGRTLEHIMPQTPNRGIWGIDKTEEQHKEYINRIGNLAFLNRGKNSSAGNKSFQDKKSEYYTKSMSPLLVNDEVAGCKVQKVIDYIKWDVSTIDKRTKELSNVIIKIMK